MLRRAAASLALAALALVCALFLYALSGLYDIAASREHLAPTRQFLEIAKRRSVAVYSAFVEVPRLDDPGLVKLGAGHFATGCAPCHGAPGAAVGPIAKRMQPAPPDLSQIAPTWSSQELFWIVRNGLKYTGMPAWPAAQRDDEVWTVVAFLRALPALDAMGYSAMTGGARPDLTQLDNHDASIRNCARCHGDASAAPVSPLVPNLNGQSATYLELSLASYAEGRRPSGIMQPIAAGLEAADRSRLAVFYAALTPPVRTAPATDARIEQGHRIATAGQPGRRIPACLTCHGDSGRATYPRLAGQSGAYLAGQLRLLQSEARALTPQGAIMTPIARLLSPEAIDAVAAYFDSQRTVAAGSSDDPQPTP